MLFSFLGGAAIGAVVALLLAPDSGQNTRHKIVDKIKHGEQKVKDAVEGGIVRPQTTVNPP